MTLNVSFDIDDTLVCGADTPSEPFVPFWARRRYPEPIRQGTRALLRALRERHCRIWLYTSSRRPTRYLRGWFRSAGFPLAGAVNLCEHEQIIGCRGPSKLPPAFAIDLHVDDSPGVQIEGVEHGFRVVLVKPDEHDWARKVLRAVDAMYAERREPVMSLRPIGLTAGPTAQPTAAMQI